jgi:hypothetical protein
MTEPVVHFTQEHRAVLIHAPDGRVFRKRSRIIAVRSEVPFTVETDRGIMRGEAGDWLVTNHPDDDPGSDLWSISDERMTATYEPEREPSIEALLKQAHALLVKVVGTGVHPLDPAVYHVELALERVARYVDVGR